MRSYAYKIYFFRAGFNQKTVFLSNRFKVFCKTFHLPFVQFNNLSVRSLCSGKTPPLEHWNYAVPASRPVEKWLNERGCPKSNECSAHWARRNDCYTKCGGFDKLNHRNANLFDCLFLCVNFAFLWWLLCNANFSYYKRRAIYAVFTLNFMDCKNI